MTDTPAKPDEVVDEHESVHVGDPDTRGKRISPWAWVPTVNFAQGLQYVVATQFFVVVFFNMGMPASTTLLWTAFLGVPWVFKPLWGPLVDRYWTKRNWTFTMQLIVGLCFVATALALQSPFYFGLSIAFLLILAFAGASHDIACDGYYMLALSRKKQAFYIGIRSTAFRVAMFFANGVLVLVAGYIQGNTGLDRVGIELRSVGFGQQAVQLETGPTHAPREYAPGEPGLVVSTPVVEVPAGETEVFTVRLNAAPENDRTQTVLLTTKVTGARVDPNRLEFTADNWDKDVRVTVHTDAKVTESIVGQIDLKAGNIRLSWSAVILLCGIMFLGFFVYHRWIMPLPAEDTSKGGNVVFLIPVLCIAVLIVGPWAAIYVPFKLLNELKTKVQNVMVGEVLPAARINATYTAAQWTARAASRADGSNAGMEADSVRGFLREVALRAEAAVENDDLRASVLEYEAALANARARAPRAEVLPERLRDPLAGSLQKIRDALPEETVETGDDTGVEALVEEVADALAEVVDAEDVPVTFAERMDKTIEILKSTEDPPPAWEELDALLAESRAVVEVTPRAEAGEAIPPSKLLPQLMTVRDKANALLAGESAPPAAQIDDLLLQTVDLARDYRIATRGFDFFYTISRFILIGAVIVFLCWFMPSRTLLADGFHGLSNVSGIGFAEVFESFFKKPGMLVVIGFLLTFRLGEAQLTYVKNVFLIAPREEGGIAMSLEAFAFTNGMVWLIALTIGGLLGGFIIAKFGLRKVIWYMVAAMHLPNLLYYYLAWAVPDNYWIINSVVAIESFGYGFGFTSFLMVMIISADGPFKTAHYALCTGFMALGMMIPGMWSGFLQELVGYEIFFLLVMLFCLPGILFIPFLPIKGDFGMKKAKDDGGS